MQEVVFLTLEWITLHAKLLSHNLAYIILNVTIIDYKYNNIYS